jgi:NADPH2:quinone reductase
MKAILCKQYGPPDSLVLEDLPPLKAGPGQVVVSVKAAGVNFPDTLIIQNKYQFKPDLPFSPGSECAGIVKELGEGVTGVKSGDAIVALTTYGSFAEEIVAKEAECIPLPKGVDFKLAAGFTLTYGTSYHALKDRAQLKPGETLLVLGAAGGVGSAAVELGKVLGARVIACASSEEKLAACKQLGADELINYETEDLRERIKQLTHEKGVDVVYDAVGGKFAEPALRALSWNGRHLVVGFAAGEIPKIPLNLALLKGCSIVGVFWGAFMRKERAASAKNHGQLMTWLARGELKPLISAVYPLAQAPRALQDLMERKAKGKVVLVTDESDAACP